MLKKIQSKIKNYFAPAEPEISVSKTSEKIRVFCPKGLIPFFFKNVVIVAHTEREARRAYESMLKKEIKLMVGNKS